MPGAVLASMRKACPAASHKTSTRPQPLPPTADKKNHVTSHHGIAKNDPYHWLRADNWQEVMRDPSKLDKKIKNYLDQENSYFAAGFGNKSKDLQEIIYREIRARIKEDDTSVPSPDGPFAYFVKMEEGKQYPVLMRTARKGGEENVLLDCNAEAGETYFGFGGAAHSPSHRYLAWAADRNGSEFFTIRVRDLETGKELDDVLTNTAGARCGPRTAL